MKTKVSKSVDVGRRLCGAGVSPANDELPSAVVPEDIQLKKVPEIDEIKGLLKGLALVDSAIREERDRALADDCAGNKRLD